MHGEDIKLDFCQQFNYPKQVYLLLENIIEVFYGKNVLSLMVIGSLSRGELSYKLENGRLALFSDIDIVAIMETRIGEGERAFLVGKIKELKKKFQPINPLFDIAVEFFSIQDFKRLPFKVRFYELKNSGKVLFGRDMRHLIPEFHINNRNIKDTNKIILNRLLGQLLYFPREILEGKATDVAQDVLKYTLAKNSLDIATVLLFQRGVFLSSYSKRVDYILSRPGEFSYDFGQDFTDFLKKCLKVKLDTDFGQPLPNMLEDVNKYFRLLLTRTLKNNGIDLKGGEDSMSLVKRSKNDVFGDSDITSAKFEFILKSPNPNLLRRRFDAISDSFLGCIILFLLNMNESAGLFLNVDKRSSSVLDNGWWVLMRMGILSGKEFLPADFVNRFLVLREKFFLDFYVKFVAPETTEHVEEILNYRYA